MAETKGLFDGFYYCHCMRKIAIEEVREVVGAVMDWDGDTGWQLR
jgi:hypothetical protein